MSRSNHPPAPSCPSTSTLTLPSPSSLDETELLDVRHSVMLLGPTGCSKTAIWRTLAGAHNLDKEEKRHTCIYETVRARREIEVDSRGV